MATHTPKFKIRLGLFVAGGMVLFIVAIFLIGKQTNLFDPVFKLSATFHNVSGLQVGSNIRFSGIDVGTVDNIKISNDSTVEVNMLIQKAVQPFIKADCIAGIGSSGLIGDRILIITQGSSDAPMSKNGQHIESVEPVEIDAIMASLQVAVENAVIITEQAAEIVAKINSGNGIVGRLFEDTTMANNISETIVSIRKSSKGLSETMNAVKDNVLFRGYFRKKQHAAQKVIDDAEEKKEKDQKAINDLKRKKAKNK